MITTPISDADYRAAIARIAAMAQRRKEDEMHAKLQQQAKKAAERRFSGQALTGFGEFA